MDSTLKVGKLMEKTFFPPGGTHTITVLHHNRLRRLKLKGESVTTCQTKEEARDVGVMGWGCTYVAV